MSRTTALCILFVLCSASVAAQYPPDLGGPSEPIDEALGQTVPPTLNTTYSTLGQDINREDIRLFLDMNITKGEVGIGGLLVGSGPIEVEADIYIRGELRVISSERIRAAVFGDNPYNVSASNSSFLTHVYLPAEVFRATVTAEALAAFQEEQEAALRQMVEETVPELEIINLDMSWRNTHPLGALTDLSLTEPPIIVELEASVKYLRVESVASLLGTYLQGRDDDSGDARKDYIKQLKEENGDVLRTRDFFAAAAYTQLLNLSMQPGWTLDVTMSVPRGFTFEYFNENVEVSEDRRTMRFVVDASDSETDVEEVLLASLTQRRAVALALFVVLWLSSTLVAFGPRTFYIKHRVPRLLAPPRSSGKPDSDA